MNADHDKLILAINAGSSSIKFSLHPSAVGCEPTFEGSIETAGNRQARLTVRGSSLPCSGQSVAADGITSALDLLINWLGDRIPAIDLQAISHRVVFGYASYAEPAIIDVAMLKALHAASAGAADHLPLQIALIESLQRRYPAAAHIACFDSGFHASMPKMASTLPIPRRYHALGVKRYGFHGISCDYILRTLAVLSGREAALGKVIIAHLGSGASITAVHRGQSRDTTMGFTTAGGIMMARRSGDLDPGLAWELARREQMETDAFHHMVNHESGLLGVSGTSADMRELLARQDTDVEAAEAVELFCYQTRKAICAMAGAIDGIDTLIFTGGIGEHAASVRGRICASLAHLGVALDPAQNACSSAVISTHAAKVCVRVMATNEQTMLAKYALTFLAKLAGSSEELSE